MYLQHLVCLKEGKIQALLCFTEPFPIWSPRGDLLFAIGDCIFIGFLFCSRLYSKVVSNCLVCLPGFACWEQGWWLPGLDTQLLVASLIHGWDWTHFKPPAFFSLSLFQTTVNK